MKIRLDVETIVFSTRRENGIEPVATRAYGGPLVLEYDPRGDWISIICDEFDAQVDRSTAVLVAELIGVPQEQSAVRACIEIDGATISVEPGRELGISLADKNLVVRLSASSCMLIAHCVRHLCSLHEMMRGEEEESETSMMKSVLAALPRGGVTHELT
jgi:hypothetical protein